MWQYKKQINAAAFVLATLVAILGAQQCLSYRQNAQPIRSTGEGIPDAAKVGDVPAAMEQCQRLMALLKENDWETSHVPLSFLQLPDRRYAEDQDFAESTMSSFVIPHPKAVAPTVPAADPKESDLAFYTSIYARRNSTYYMGDKMRSQPSGFYIVGLKNGSVFQVPVADVRMIKGETRKGILVFPGMKAYDPKALRLPEVEFADGNTSPEKEAAYKRDVVEDCPGCSK